LAGELGNSPAARQLQLANVLGRRADAAALPALLAVARSGEKEARVAAITALAEIGSAEAAVPLTGWLKDPDADVAKTAATALAGLPGEQVNAAVIGSLEAPDPELRHKMLELVRERRIAKALPVLLKMMDDPDGGLRLAAIRSYADLAGASGLGSLLAQVLTAAEPAEIDALEKALGAVCAVAEQPQECGKQLAEALPKAGAVAKPAILRTLRLSGGPAALAAVRGAVGDPEKEVHNAAIRVLSEWKSADAAPMLLYLAQNSTQPVDKILCLRGYLGMATQPALPLPQKLTICRESAKLIERDDEKRLLLGALASAADAAGLDLAVVYLDDAAVKREAVATVMAIAEKRPAGQHVALARAALDKVVQVAADNPPLVQRAQELLKAIEAEPK
jgi:HEAT repeat protein